MLSTSILSVCLNFNPKADASNASTVCKITDPTGTPLNVRSHPNGKIINRLQNGKNVDITEIGYDNRGRHWVKVAGYHNGKYREWGWVIREFVSCYET
ncbi:MAG: SH3 domain-containing protein [Methylacidiphilales bacterium]|nr:SH3 domain-containing protein [Candidatus Methylacidiphilales bacterium]